MLAIITLVLALTLTTSSQPVGSLTPQVKYMHPSNDSISCTVSKPCTFDQYANDSKQHFCSNTTFIFLPGDHLLHSSISLHGIHNISFRGKLTEGPVTIRLGPQVGYNFSNYSGIKISSLNFLLSGDYEYRLMFYNTISVNLQSIVISIEDEDSTGNSAILSQESMMNISDSGFIGISGRVFVFSQLFCLIPLFFSLSI